MSISLFNLYVYLNYDNYLSCDSNSITFGISILDYPRIILLLCFVLKYGLLLDIVSITYTIIRA